MDRFTRSYTLWFALTATAAVGGVGCTDSLLSDQLYPARSGDAGMGLEGLDAGADGAAGDTDAAQVESTACVPALASDPLPARSNVMARSGAAAPSGVFTSDLFGLFASNCGGCHVDSSLGGFHVTPGTFATVVGQEAFKRLTSDDPKYFMPPTNREPFSKLAKTSPLRELATLLEAWLAAGRPADVFYPQASTNGTDDAHRYLLTKVVGTQMTNLANCIPAASMVRTAPNADDALDDMFADATELPGRLEETDLVTLDAEQLAKQGVVAFAPAYTLWADNAKKIRMVRVPRGKSIAFDSDTQSFVIPANTRFYKTFFKHVIDIRGNESYRKMETRLIVSRPDKTLPDGTTEHTALFGTYAWNEAETEAVLVRDPLRNGKPFRDRTFTYVTDEHMAEDVITDAPGDLQEALREAGITRTYAIPGSERCIQCHMGSTTQSFVLGFSPLQLYRRAVGEGGVVEPAKRDELNQLQRLIDYGVITGMASPRDVTLLEDSEGARKPRNDHELKAQGYMLGNCAHCHNPGGFPSRIAPELRDTLNFFPSHEGGIFQFPLEKFSPRIFRGVYQNVPQPYITPGLYDRPPATTLPGGTDVGPEGDSNYAAKEIFFEQVDTRPIANQPLLAPWRSLIYRNVDAPFTYEEDFSIYPRMPMNTPGYDCRVRQLLGEWMVSIPARMKETDAFKAGGVTELFLTTNHPEPQPYAEVSPDDPDFSRQQRIAESNVHRFQQSERYSDCPDPGTVDTVDRSVVIGDELVPGPLNRTLYHDDGTPFAGYALRVPEQEHYAVTDLTEPQGDWNPRRADWDTLLVDLELNDILDPGLRARIRRLNGIVISDELRTAALKDVPFGMWQKKDGCNFKAQAKAGDFTGSHRPLWMLQQKPVDGDPVYSISAGAEIFTQICQNCHGPQADSKGRLAATIADMTGGQTRVANLRDGLFGPTDDPGSNLDRIFAPYATADVKAEDWAARYLMFMGLGGTQRTIPTPALQTIRNGSVIGQRRADASSLDVSTANMLSVPLALCRATLPGSPTSFLPWEGAMDFSRTATYKSALIASNGDYELWKNLCRIDNEPVPLRVIIPDFKTGSIASYRAGITALGGLRLAASYPPTAKVGNHLGQVQTGIATNNEAPWCMSKPINAVLQTLIEAEWHARAPAGVELPYCPDAFIADPSNLLPVTEADETKQSVERWATRGAMNAGMAVFLYLRALSAGDKKPVIPYDRCDLL